MAWPPSTLSVKMRTSWPSIHSIGRVPARPMSFHQVKIEATGVPLFWKKGPRTNRSGLPHIFRAVLIVFFVPVVCRPCEGSCPSESRMISFVSAPPVVGDFFLLFSVLVAGPFGHQENRPLCGLEPGKDPSFDPPNDRPTCNERDRCCNCRRRPFSSETWLQPRPVMPHLLGPLVLVMGRHPHDTLESMLYWRPVYRAKRTND